MYTQYMYIDHAGATEGSGNPAAARTLTAASTRALGVSKGCRGMVEHAAKLHCVPRCLLCDYVPSWNR